jgi:hypothetical protein
MYTREQVDEAFRNFLQWLDFDGTKQVLENMIAHGEIEIARIGEDGGFVFRLVGGPEVDEDPTPRGLA